MKLTYEYAGVVEMRGVPEMVIAPVKLDDVASESGSFNYLLATFDYHDEWHLNFNGGGRVITIDKRFPGDAGNERWAPNQSPESAEKFLGLPANTLTKETYLPQLREYLEGKLGDQKVAIPILYIDDKVL